MKHHQNNSASLLLLLCVIHAITESANCNGDESTDKPYFKRATKSPYFVDKTMLLKYFLHLQRVLFIRPTNFGKTTNLDMVRRFFQLSFDLETRQRIDKTTTHYYQLFTNKSTNLRIAKDERFIEQHMHEYPLIYINFANIQGTTIEKIVASVAQKVEHALKPYRSLYRGKLRSRSPLKDMIKFLENRFRNKVIVLIDNFDNPVQHAIANGAAAFHIGYTLESMLRNVSQLESQNCLIMMTAISHRSKNLVKFHQNHLMKIENDLDHYFGFTENEVDRLQKAQNIDTNERSKIKKYFDGYTLRIDNCDGSTDRMKSPLYHPKGVLRYFETNSYQMNHSTSVAITTLIKCLRHKRYFHKIAKLLSQESIHFRCSDDDDSNENRLLVEFAKNNCSEEPRSHCTKADHTYSFPYLAPFLDHGYLAVVDTKSEIFSKHTYNVYVANTMMRDNLKQQFHNFYLTTYGINICDSYVNTTIQSIVNSDITSAQMLSDLTASLCQLLRPLHGKRVINYKFEYASIVHATLIFLLDFYKEIEIKNNHHDSTSFQFYENHFHTLRIPNRDRQILTIIKITVDQECSLNDTVDALATYWPAEPPRSNSSFSSIKLLVINLNKRIKQMQIVNGKNRNYR